MLAVLRYGHRKERDKRTTTHVGLVARAFGADMLILTDTDDLTAKKTLDDVTSRWGGNFRVELKKGWKKAVMDWKKRGALVIHLTMYGLPVDNVISEIRKQPDREILVFVGAEKVPSEIYSLADYNVSVGSQPHSEIAALAIFLDRFFEGKELSKKFAGARMEIQPQAKGKQLLKL